MQYAKMDLAKFAENVKGGRYETRTAARRAAGKADWSAKDRDAAHALINKTWGDDDVPSKPKRAKAAKPAKRAAKAAPAKAASSPPPAKKAAKPAKRAPRAQAAPTASSLPVQGSDLRRAPVTLGPQEPVSTSRMVASAGVIQALKNVTPLTPVEKLAYDVAVAEFTVNESDEARTVRMGQRPVEEPKRAPQTKAQPRKTPTNGASESAPAAPTAPATRPHIAVPPAAAVPAPTPSVGEDPDEANLTPEQKAQLKRVRESVAAMPDFGPAIPAPPLG
jgi:hypothetical protein